MIISCTSCATRYVIQEKEIGGNGRAVKCIKCNYCWIISSNSEKPFWVTNNKTGAYPLSISPETYLANNIEDTINPGSTQDYQKTAGQENIVSPIGQPGRVNLKKTLPNDGTSSSKIKNLTTQSKSTIRDNKPNRRKGVIVCLVLFFLLTGTLGGAVKYREWVIRSWPSVADVYIIMGLTMLVQ